MLGLNDNTVVDDFSADATCFPNVLFRATLATDKIYAVIYICDKTCSVVGMFFVLLLLIDILRMWDEISDSNTEAASVNIESAPLTLTYQRHICESKIILRGIA